MSTFEARLSALRTELQARNLDGFVVPLTDEHMSEYVGEYAQRLAWLTGFEGSAGTAVVLRDKTAIFVDGRYTLQVRDQVDGRFWSYESVPATSVVQWLGSNVKEGARIGYDPWLHTRGWVDAGRAAMQKKAAALVAEINNPVDAIWHDRPAPSAAPVIVHPLEFAGQASSEKRADIAAWLQEKAADAVVLSALDSIAWVFNIRGSDVARTPVALSFAMVFSDGTARLFVDQQKLDDEVCAHLGAEVQLGDRCAFAGALSELTGKRVIVDPSSAVVAIFEQLEQAGAVIIEARDPAVLPKAIKNDVEIAGTKAAHLRDGAALTRFLCWMLQEAPKGTVDELGAADRLEQFRRETGCLRDLSFDTISGAGPNGAVVHYRVSERTNRPVQAGELYLVDSGGQYADGTTDVTRTIAIGQPTAEMCDRFTRVLKGHIALACAVFPAGTRGSQLDVLARQYLWNAGVDYAHGTGHGVGSYLSVHEGPQRIATAAAADEPLQPGMIVSNEPGYYKTDAFGIRIENLVLVKPLDVDGAERDMLAFETLTLAPIDRALINVSMMTRDEVDWVNSYHSRVREMIGPCVDRNTRIWLEDVTRPL